MKANYGIDAPYIIILQAIIANSYMLLGVYFYFLHISLYLTFFSIGFLLLFIPIFMLLSSKKGKIKQRDKILKQVSFKGDEKVLDIGTGRGLMAIGAAKYVPEGEVIGIDIWQNSDQANNTKKNTLKNIQIEEVSKNCKVIDGDARDLKFPNESFDVILANFSLHNIPTQEGKKKACLEISRVLKKGGKLYNYDMFYTIKPFVTYLKNADLKVKISPWQFLTFPPGKLLIAEKDK